MWRTVMNLIQLYPGWLNVPVKFWLLSSSLERATHLSNSLRSQQIASQSEFVHFWKSRRWTRMAQILTLSYLKFELCVKDNRESRGQKLWPFSESPPLEDAIWHDTRALHHLVQSVIEILRSATSHRLHRLPQALLLAGTDFVTPSAVVWVLGILHNSYMSISSHVRKTVSICFAVMRQVRSIRRSVSRPVVQSLVKTLVLSRLDYGNVTLVGIPHQLLWRLQSVMNAAAR